MITVLCLIAFMGLTSLAQIEPAPVNLWHLVWTIVVPVIAGLYEVIVRVIPSVKNYSFIGKIIEILLS
jgi:hypothetical protein